MAPFKLLRIRSFDIPHKVKQRGRPKPLELGGSSHRPAMSCHKAEEATFTSDVWFPHKPGQLASPELDDAPVLVSPRFGCEPDILS